MQQSVESLSLRRAWIEISIGCPYVAMKPGRSPYGERGLKSEAFLKAFETLSSRSPYGERGLKSGVCRMRQGWRRSLSLRRAWIEIGLAKAPTSPRLVALLTESVD